MTEPNYEAIGRCQVLKEKIDALNAYRNQRLKKLAKEAFQLTEGYYPQKGFPVLDTEKMNALLADITAADIDLRRAISEFNDWSQTAGEEPIKLTGLTSGE
ncbi:hypothetical protein Xsto_04006 [Xenorhabdus stockiae]|uniref:Uncharacterized protein n=1 Tax=Xenorhabdus stockiae TaxID=351614 RepID=A0A2D0KAR4_9GAMM|nr:MULTISPECIES: hypothetical protein [Xenorhabdus]PHM60452.1 hypothetical protein Xsto_04006 [Xenorhabdus stockiae]PHM66707.1 hypothetical protein Xekj_04060 [Xenorhabdus sp. KJ12.1]